MIDAYIRRYGRRLYGLCLTLCGDPFDAEDLYQDTWLKVLRSIRRYDASRDFEPWLTAICVNTYRNALRRLARSPVLRPRTAEQAERILRDVPAPEPPEEYAALRDAVGRLPERLRLAVILYYFEDMDIASAARALNVPPGTVKSRLSRARSQLKEVLRNGSGDL